MLALPREFAEIHHKDVLIVIHEETWNGCDQMCGTAWNRECNVMGPQCWHSGTPDENSACTIRAFVVICSRTNLNIPWYISHEIARNRDEGPGGCRALVPGGINEHVIRPNGEPLFGAILRLATNKEKRNQHTC